MNDRDRQDSLDELFEPFELDETPPPDEDLPPSPAPAAAEPVTGTVNCPSCGTENPDYNRHCEACGARLSQEPLPVAAPPMMRGTPGGRALAVLAAVVLVVALIALIFNVFGGNGGDEEAAETTTTTTSTQPPVVEEMFASTVEASSELPGFEAENLIDGNPETSWNDQSNRGRDASLTFRFTRPVQITRIELQNLEDEVRFKRNYRIQGYQISVDDLAIEITGRLEDTNASQDVQIASLETTELTIVVTSTFPAQAVEDLPPFDELALQGVRFFGSER